MYSRNKITQHYKERGPLRDHGDAHSVFSLNHFLLIYSWECHDTEIVRLWGPNQSTGLWQCCQSGWCGRIKRNPVRHHQCPEEFQRSLSWGGVSESAWLGEELEGEGTTKGMFLLPYFVMNVPRFIATSEGTMYIAPKRSSNICCNEDNSIHISWL